MPLSSSSCSVDAAQMVFSAVVSFRRNFPGIVIYRMESNQDIDSRFLNDDAFKQIILQVVARQVYD